MKVAKFVMNEITQVMIMISGSVAPLPIFDYLYAGQKVKNLISGWEAWCD